MDAEEQYKKVCQKEFQCIIAKLDKFDDKLDKFNDRLFMDNGRECLQSKINRHDDWVKRFGGFLVCLWGVVIIVITALVKKWLF